MPKVFISYCWSSTEHQLRVKDWADRLISDGVEVVMDIYDLKEGQELNSFIEKMANDSSLTHVLIFSDKKYMEKGNERKAGVGIESQIISKQVYEKVGQSKFIPIVCEFDENGIPYLPTFLSTRKWIDFSTFERVNNNWEQLIRCLYDKPQYRKPQLGNEPTYLTKDEDVSAGKLSSTYQTLYHSYLHGKNGLKQYRRIFFDECLFHVKSLLVNKQPENIEPIDFVIETYVKLKPVRNYIVDWVLFESGSLANSDFNEELFNFFEELLVLKGRPNDVTTWSDFWYEGHGIFVYETFIYMIAALLRTNSFGSLNEMLTSHYLLPKKERDKDRTHETFYAFYSYANSLTSLSDKEGRKYYSPVIELISRNADHSVITFGELIDADLLCQMMAFIMEDGNWFPQTIYYRSFSTDYPLFLRAKSHKHFQNIEIITGVKGKNELVQSVNEGIKRLDLPGIREFGYRANFVEIFNLESLDSIS